MSSTTKVAPGQNGFSHSLEELRWDREKLSQQELSTPSHTAMKLTEYNIITIMQLIKWSDFKVGPLKGRLYRDRGGGRKIKHHREPLYVKLDLCSNNDDNQDFCG